MQIHRLTTTIAVHIYLKGPLFVPPLAMDAVTFLSEFVHFRSKQLCQFQFCLSYNWVVAIVSLKYLKVGLHGDTGSMTRVMQAFLSLIGHFFTINCCMQQFCAMQHVLSDTDCMVHAMQPILLKDQNTPANT